MGVHFPAEIANGGFVHHRGDTRKIRRDVVLKTVLADIVQQLL